MVRVHSGLPCSFLAARSRGQTNAIESDYNRKMSRPSSFPVRPILLSLLAGMCLFGLGASVEFIFRNHPGRVLLDDVLSGLAAAFVVFMYERRRARLLASNVATISLMNHHVRNALQAIKYAHFLERQDKQQLDIIGSAVDRIEWTLTDILPGTNQESDPPSLRASGTGSNEKQAKSA